MLQWSSLLKFPTYSLVSSLIYSTNTSLALSWYQNYNGEKVRGTACLPPVFKINEALPPSLVLKLPKTPLLKHKIVLSSMPDGQKHIFNPFLIINTSLISNPDFLLSTFLCVIPHPLILISYISKASLLFKVQLVHNSASFHRTSEETLFTFEQ